MSRQVSIRARALSRGVFAHDVAAHTLTFDDAREVTERAIRAAVLERTNCDSRARLTLDDIVVTYRGVVLRDVDAVVDARDDGGGEGVGAAVLVAVKPRARGRAASGASASGTLHRRRRRRIVNGVIVDDDEDEDGVYADEDDEDAELCEPLSGARARRASVGRAFGPFPMDCEFNRSCARVSRDVMVSWVTLGENARRGADIRLVHGIRAHIYQPRRRPTKRRAFGVFSVQSRRSSAPGAVDGGRFRRCDFASPTSR